MPGGRRTELTPIVHDAILKAVKVGASREVAAQAAGIGQSTLYKWLAQGRRGEEPYVELLEDIKIAQAEAIKHHLAIISRSAKKTWQAAAWWLERIYPLVYGKRESVLIAEMEERLKALEGKKKNARRS